jgi:hypothetical protein
MKTKRVMVRYLSRDSLVCRPRIAASLHRRIVNRSAGVRAATPISAAAGWKLADSGAERLQPAVQRAAGRSLVALTQEIPRRPDQARLDQARRDRERRVRRFQALLTCLKQGQSER